MLVGLSASAREQQAHMGVTGMKRESVGCGVWFSDLWNED
jgi:hypothetical protein